MKMKLMAIVALMGASTLVLGAPTKRVKRAKNPTASIYVLGQVGTSKLDVAKSNLKDNWGPNARLAFGYMFSSASKLSYGVEAGVMEYAKYTHKGKTYTRIYSGQNIDLLGVAKYKLNKKVNLFGKAGLDYVGQKLADEDHNYRPEVQVGVGYKLSKKMEASVTYSDIYGKRDQKYSEKTKTLPLHSALVGLQYKLV